MNAYSLLAWDIVTLWSLDARKVVGEPPDLHDLRDILRLREHVQKHKLFQINLTLDPSGKLTVCELENHHLEVW